jgi:leader peptidase (prepilin peptidase)/N-methyltransferase
MILFIMIMGFIFGNFTTSFYYRISNERRVNGYKSLSGEAPHCSSCKHPLKFYEYLPILSIFSTKFRFICNYCGASINPVYTILEFSTAILFALNYMYVTSGESLVLTLLLIPVGILTIALRINDNKIPNYLLWFAAFLGVLYRTISDGTFYIWFLHLSIFMLVIISIYKDKEADFSSVALRVSVLAISCCWLETIPLLIMLGIHSFICLIRKLDSKYIFSLDWLILYFMIIISEAIL